MQSLLFVLVLVTISAIGYTLQDRSYKFDSAGVALLVLSTVMLLFFFLLMPIIRMEEHSNIRAYHAFNETIDTARMSELSGIERANLTVKISEWNEYVAKIQYQNETVFDWWIPDDVMELKMIK